jgi:hypothetical protein
MKGILLSCWICVPRGGDYEEYDLLCCSALQFEKRPTFRRNMLLPSSGYKNKPRKKPAESGGKLSSAFHLILLVSCLVYSLTLKMDVRGLSET